ncbi:MAG TPA: FtsX-like permease family protein, partial [Gemmataceae bacterium]|nr:FtsX-like permease family protein [Gemmataceae bacterium]
LERVDPGFNPTRLLTLRITPNFSRYVKQDQYRLLSETILRRAQAASGVELASLASNFPFSPSGIQSGPGTVSFEIEGRPVSKGELAPLIDTTIVSAHYFATIRQPLVQGRFFDDHDDAKAPPVAVINQAMARHRWPNEDPIGKRVSFDNGETWVKIVGVAGDVKEYGLELPVGDELYLALAQNRWVPDLVIRTALNPMSIAPTIRAAIHDIDPQLAVDRVETVENLEYESVASPRVTASLLGLFAGLALLISASGIAAVMALSVTQRTQEMGIRMALGAPRGSIVNMVIREGLTLCLIGTVLGIAGSIALTRLMSSLLYGTSATDIRTFAAVSAVFLLVAGVACMIPARQVTAIDPLIALRQE